MSNDPKPRPSYLPGRDFNRLTIPATLQPRRYWFRVHRSRISAIQFGILSHHRFSHPNCPFPLLYVGASLSVCLWRRCLWWPPCHIRSQVEWLQHIPDCGSTIKVCAVSLEATRNAMGVDKASLLAADIRIPQRWGLAVQQHPAAFEAIRFSSRFVHQPCLALFDRGGMAEKLHETLLGDLKDIDAAVNWLDEQNAALV